MIKLIVAGCLAATGTIVPAAAARAADVAVVLGPPPAACRREAPNCAVGLLVPGAGPTVTRRGALASLVRGKVRQANLGGVPTGPPMISLARAPARLTFYVTLPPPGRHHNVRRYPLAIVGPGWRGILESDSTRIPGLVSIADVAPAARALADGREPDLRSRADRNPQATLRRLDRRLAGAHAARGWATGALVALVLGLAAATLAKRAPALGRAAVVASPACLLAALTLSAVHVADAWVVTLALLAGGGAIALGAGSGDRSAQWFVVGFLALELLVLAAWPTVNSLATIGPHPDGGGRFYGVTNQVETLFIAPILLAGALLGAAWLVPLGLLAVVAVGWSGAGADGGGVLVLLVALGVLALRTRREGLGARQIALVGAGVVAAALAFVAVDAATGGSSHVTRAVEDGPGSLADDLAHRVDVSWAGASSSWHSILLVLACLTILIWLGTRTPRRATVDALLAALAVSLLVNDTPTDVLAFGALSCAALVAWERVRAGPV